MTRNVGTIPGVSAMAFALMLSAACSSRGPRVVEDRPPLAVPPVPARTIEPTPVILPPVVELPADPPPPTPTAAKPKPATPQAKPEPKPEVPADSGTATVNPPPPVAPLRTPTSPIGPEAARQIREVLIRAQGILNNVDYQKLSTDRRVTYDSAKSYITQSEDALKRDDLMLARSFAERAEVIAKQLEGR